MNLPNTLTIGRIFLVPVVVTLLLAGDIHTRTFWGASLFLAAALTDLLDGYLARRRKQVTTLGRLLDPIADKLLISSALIALVQRGLAPAWMVVIIIGREFAVNGLRQIAAHEGFSINVSRIGKGKMVTQVAAVIGLILAEKYGGSWPRVNVEHLPDTLRMVLSINHGGWVEITAQLLLWAVVVFALVSMVQYFRDFWSRLDSSVKFREKRHMKILERRQQWAAERRELRRLRRLERSRHQQQTGTTLPPSK